MESLGYVNCDGCNNLTDREIYCCSCAKTDASSRAVKWIELKLSLGQITAETAEELQGLVRELAR